MNTSPSKLIRLACITTAFITSLGLFQFASQPTAHAEAASGPMVLVAVDATTPSCRTQRTVTVGTSRSTTGALPCLPGTVMKTERVPLSEALARHLSYLALSSATSQSIDAMVQEQRQALRRLLAPESSMPLREAASPMTTCGWYVDIYTNALIDGDTLDGTMQYYLSRDCSHVVIDYAQSELVSQYYNVLYWFESNYQEPWYRCIPWGSDTCGWYGSGTVAPPYHTYTITINSTNPSGYDFVNTYDDSAQTIYSLDFGILA
ncbi:MAG TPA: hypothetical protein VGR57_04525 [Ktedonobacterales bacterium]|nr:hypothetical protein [Ktedonobacterales bacterium]